MRYVVIVLGLLLFSFSSSAAPGAFSLLTPSANQLLEDPSQLPAITWQKSNGAVAYEVSLRMIKYEVTPWLKIPFIPNVPINVPIEGVNYTFTLTCDDTTCAIPITYPTDWTPFYDWDGVYRWNVTAIDAMQNRTASSNGPLTFTVDVPEPDLLKNRSFEDDTDLDGVPDSWAIVKRTNDGQVCGTAYKSGNCALRFMGSATEAARLRQTVDLTGVTLGKNYYMELVVWYNGISARSNANAVLIVDYVNPNVPNSILTIPLGSTTGYARKSGYLTLRNGNVKAVIVRIDNKTSSGRFIVDDLSLTVTNAPTP